MREGERQRNVSRGDAFVFGSGDLYPSISTWEKEDEKKFKFSKYGLNN